MARCIPAAQLPAAQDVLLPRRPAPRTRVAQTPGGAILYRVVQLNFTLEIEVLYMLFDRYHSICSMTCLRQHMEYFSFRCLIHLDLPVVLMSEGIQPRILQTDWSQLYNTGIVKKAGARLRDPASCLPFAAGAGSCNLQGHTFFNIPVIMRN